MEMRELFAGLCTAAAVTAVGTAAVYNVNEHENTAKETMTMNSAETAVTFETAITNDNEGMFGPKAAAAMIIADSADSEVNIKEGSYQLDGVYSGTVTVTKKVSLFSITSEVEIVYDNYSNDGLVFYNGSEYVKGSLFTKTKYISNVEATDRGGNVLSSKEADMTFDEVFEEHALSEDFRSPILHSKDSKLKVTWKGETVDIADLLPQEETEIKR